MPVAIVILLVPHYVYLFCLQAFSQSDEILLI